MAVVHIDQEKCNGCGNCVDACPMGVFALIEERATCVASEDCMICKMCETLCPNLAITVEE